MDYCLACQTQFTFEAIEFRNFAFKVFIIFAANYGTGLDNNNVRSNWPLSWLFAFVNSSSSCK